VSKNWNGWRRCFERLRMRARTDAPMFLIGPFCFLVPHRTLPDLQRMKLCGTVGESVARSEQVSFFLGAFFRVPTNRKWSDTPYHGASVARLGRQRNSGELPNI
jgi:hypothetical protein